MAFQPDVALQYLEQARNGGRLAHAYLVVAADDTACDEFAAAWIGRLTGREGVAALADLEAPNVRVIKPESKSRRIRVEQIARLEHLLQLAAAPGELKIGVFQQAHRLVPEAANKFLKTLEEPPPHTLLVLLTSAPGQILDTVLSRCLRVELHNPGRRRLNDWQLQWVEHLSAALAAAAGRLDTGQALGLTRAFAAVLGELRKEVESGVKEAVRERSDAYGKAIEDGVLKREEEANKARVEALYLEQREQLLAVTLALLGDVLRRQNQVDRLELPEHAALTTSLAAQWSRDQTIARLESWRELHATMSTNVNETLALEVAFLQTFT